MTYRRFGLSLAVLAAMVAAFSASPVSANAVPVISDSQLQATTTTVGGVGGAPSLNTSTTVAHWFGQTTDPHNGVTYGYNMVGADPNNCSGSACDVTVEADVQPLIVNVAGLTFDGRDVMAATLNSPQFTLNDYGSTTHATVPGVAPARLTRGDGGSLSQGDAGNLLQI